MALFQTMGLYWERENVFWGKQKQSGTLLGVDVESKKDDPVDFRDQVGIYILYADYDPAYVGQSGSKENQRLFHRLRQHTKDDLAGRWNRFTWFGVLRVNLTGLLQEDIASIPKTEIDVGLNHLEGILIHAMEPHLNSQNGRFGDQVTRYIQVRDERLGPSDDEMLKTVYDYVLSQKK